MDMVHVCSRRALLWPWRGRDTLCCVLLLRCTRRALRFWFNHTMAIAWRTWADFIEWRREKKKIITKWMFPVKVGARGVGGRALTCGPWRAGGMAAHRTCQCL